MSTFSISPMAMKNIIVDEPPYEISGSGMPVVGSTPICIDTLMRMWKMKNEIRQIARNVPPRSRAFFAKFMDPAARENSFTFVTYSGNTNAGAVEWLWKATHNQDFAGLSARGRETKVRGVSVLTFGSGKIASCHDYWDARTLMQQLGAATS